MIQPAYEVICDGDASTTLHPGHDQRGGRETPEVVVAVLVTSHHQGADLRVSPGFGTPPLEKHRTCMRGAHEPQRR